MCVAKLVVVLCRIITRMPKVKGKLSALMRAQIEGRNLCIVSVYTEDEWSIMGKIEGVGAWGATRFIHATAHTGIIDAFKTVSPATTTLVFVPKHGSKGAEAFLTDNLHKPAQTARLLAEMLIACPRVHIHTCWMGIGLRKLLADVWALPGFKARLAASSTTTTVTVSAFVSPLKMEPTSFNTHDRYLMCGALTSPTVAHRRCCGKHARIIKLRIDGSIVSDSIFGGKSTYEPHA